MRSIIGIHSVNAYLKPGEVIISRNPILVSTILGSCVAVTMYSASKGVGAICHAIFPHHTNKEASLHYVDTAIRHIFKKMIEYEATADMVVKLFGGAQVLAGADYGEDRKSIGELNIQQAKRTLRQMGLTIAREDVGGPRGRKLLFSIKTGDVLLRRLKLTGTVYCPGE